MPTIQPLEAGQTAPTFVFTEGDRVVSSSDLDVPCLLYFYPKDDTPGCTKEACGIRDQWSQFEDVQLKVVGVSKDSEVSHEKFRKKYELPFPLIADEDLALSQAYGVYGEKKFMGRIYDGIHRISFLISKDGIILKTYLKVKPDQHASVVLEDLSTFNT
ncbi:MAG: thioredoxin-dependent thiol peroxidase [Opitutaceae bacterium]